eukprot:6361903-Pyramimonas_sp.AAC.1
MPATSATSGTFSSSAPWPVASVVASASARGPCDEEAGGAGRANIPAGLDVGPNLSLMMLMGDASWKNILIGILFHGCFGSSSNGSL